MCEKPHTPFELSELKLVPTTIDWWQQVCLGKATEFLHEAISGPECSRSVHSQSLWWQVCLCFLNIKRTLRSPQK
uniref:Uncharacterized protein n=1 Tax=Anguilla anguilla TaxID=7936 RepID=A0A0E9WLW5_ANGAN